MAEEILPAQCASIIAWLLACLEVHNDRLLLVLATLAEPKLAEFKFYEALPSTCRGQMAYRL